MAKFDPYRKWLGIPPLFHGQYEQPPNHYRLLGIGLYESDPDVISNAADRQMVHLRSFQSGKQGQLSGRLLNEVSAARVCLLDQAKRGVYDTRLREELAAAAPPPPPPRTTGPPPPRTTGPPPPRIPTPPPPSGNSGPPEATVPLFPGNTVQSAAETVSEPIRVGGHVRRKKSAWQGTAVAIALLAVTLGLMFWAMSNSNSGQGDLVPPVIKHNGTGQPERPLTPKQPRKKKPRPSKQPTKRPSDPRPPFVKPVGQGTGPQDAVGEIRAFTGHKKPATDAVFSPDGAFVLSGSDDQSVRLWNLADGTQRQFAGARRPIIAVAFSPDGELVLAITGHTGAPDNGAPDNGAPDTGGMVRIWEAVGGREIVHIDISNTGTACDAEFSPNGRLIALACRDETIRLLDAANRKRIKESKRLSGHEGPVRCVAFSPDGNRILSGGEDRTLVLWDVSTGEEIRRISGHAAAVTSVAFSPDGQSAISGSLDNTVRLWDLQTGKQRVSLAGHRDAVTCVAWMPNGQFFLSGSLDRTVRIWRLADATEVHRFDGHEGGVRSIAVSADGRRAVSCGDDATVRLWGLPDAESLLAATPDTVKSPHLRTTQREAVPDAESLRRAEEQIRNALKQEFAAANHTAGKLALAAKLLAVLPGEEEEGDRKPVASTLSRDPATIYALLQLAKDQAAAAGDAETAVAAADEIAARYEVDALGLKIETLQTALEASPGSTAMKRSLARRIFAAIEDALSADDFDAAGKLVGMADAAVKKVRDPQLSNLAKTRANEIDQLQQTYQAVVRALDVLAGQPADPQASQLVGTYYAVIQGDWPRGLPRLAAAADEKLKQLAQTDLSNPTATGQRHALANGWWELAESRSGREKENLHKRAAKWYKLIEPELAGADQATARNRLLAAGDMDVRIDPATLPKFTALECRDLDIRPRMLRAFGGNAESEAAVEKALGWLAARQTSQGSWSFAHVGTYRPGTRGPGDKYPDPGKLDNARGAATALALLPFLGAGHGPKQGMYRANVSKGLNFLRVRMARTVQRIGVPTLYEPEAGQMPSHALGTIVLCEVCALGADPRTRNLAQAAVDVIVATQNSDGGFSSKPSPPEASPGLSGMYPTGWNVAALKAAQWAGLNVPDKTLREAERYIKSMRAGSGYRRSDKSTGPDPTATAVAMLAQTYLLDREGGRPRTDKQLRNYAAALARSGPPTDGQLYLNYYNAQVMRDCGDPISRAPTSRTWNATLRDYLIASQATEGDLAGSWFLRDTGWSTAAGGRLFCTALAALTLEVYYRYPPLD